jgi:hypothetical protein
MTAGFGNEAQGPQPPAPGGPYPGLPPQQTPPPSPLYAQPMGLGTDWTPGGAPVRMPQLPKGVDLGIIVIGVGALLTLIGFLCGAGAVGQYGSGGSVSAYQAWLGAFFVLTGIGIFLVVGGWVYRAVMAARRVNS